MSKVSIIVPVYNAERYLEACIQSVIRQEYADWELLLVNDGSRDGSEAVCKQHADDLRVRYIYKENSGVTETRWKGIEAATGEYITFLDADDVLLPNALTTLVEAMESSGADIVTFGMQNFVEDTELVPETVDLSEAVTITDKTEVMKSILLGKMLSCVWGGLYKREALLPCKDIFCNGLRIGEDMMFNFAFTERYAPKVVCLKARLYGYRTNPASAMHAITPTRFESNRQVMAYLTTFLRDHNLTETLHRENAFRQLLLWSTFVFNKGSEYYTDKALRKAMRSLYWPAFRYLYPYLRFYLFVDFYVVRYQKIK